MKSHNLHKIQKLTVTTFIVAANLVSLSAVRPPAAALAELSWPPRPDFSVLVGSDQISLTTKPEVLAQYHRSEWESPEENQDDLKMYYQSERMQPTN